MRMLSDWDHMALMWNEYGYPPFTEVGDMDGIGRTVSILSKS